MNNMSSQNKMNIQKDIAKKQMSITRRFDADRDDVWSAFTESEILDQWWAPEPWKAETKRMDFRVGGHWLYAMVGPDGTRHWARADYTAIEPKSTFSVRDAFCDENGNINNEAPLMNWQNTFIPVDNGTEVRVVITFEREGDLQEIIRMGFEEGFTAGLNQLEKLLAAK